MPYAVTGGGTGPVDAPDRLFHLV